MLRYVLIVYDVKQASEAETYPNTRIPPLKLARFKKIVAAVLDARKTAAGYAAPQLVGGDMFIIFDGKRSGNASRLKQPFVDESEDKPLPMTRSQLHIVFQEKGITSKKAVNRRGTGAVKQNEVAHMVTRVRPRMATRARRHFEGTTLGDTIGHVPAEDDDKQWSLTVAKKRELYDKYRVAVGGKDGSDAETDADEEEDAVPEESPNKANPPALHKQHLCESCFTLASLAAWLQRFKAFLMDFDSSEHLLEILCPAPSEAQEEPRRRGAHVLPHHAQSAHRRDHALGELLSGNRPHGRIRGMGALLLGGVHTLFRSCAHGMSPERAPLAPREAGPPMFLLSYVNFAMGC